jgi:CubicO group peptidase (beta-lactamase class C family)
MRLLLFLSILVSWQTAVAQSEAAAVESLLNREMRERRIPGVQAVVVKNGRIILSVASGTADIQHSVAVTKQTVFPIYSCTKAFTGVAIMQLVEEGKLDLSAPISRYLDDLPERWRPITVKQLLTHVSGLPNILRLLDPITYGLPAGVTEEDLWKKIKSQPMVSAVGERFSYNPNKLRAPRKDHRQAARQTIRRSIQNRSVSGCWDEEHQLRRFARRDSEQDVDLPLRQSYRW